MSVHVVLMLLSAVICDIFLVRNESVSDNDKIYEDSEEQKP